MNINGVQIPAFMVEIIKDHMVKLINDGMPADVDTLHYAVAMADRDVQGICTQLLAGNFKTNASEMRDAVAASVYSSLTA